MPLSTIADLTIADGPLVISMGDPAGIGPEVIAAAWAERTRETLPAFAVVGDPAAFLSVPVRTIDSLAEAASVFAHALPLLGSIADENSPGHQAFAALAEATRLTVEGQARALITAPIHKARAYAAGFAWPGQTEYLASACNIAADDTVMMLAGDDLRTVPLTIHLPLRDVAAALTHDLIIRRARTTHAALMRDFGIALPRLVIAGLNPHAGEHGSIGCEDRDLIVPAVAQLQSEGINIRGPLSADTLFHARARATFDVALCCYHDQALIPVKTLAFDSGVNITLGLPIIRTSPDHGTADDIAGRGLANPSAMIEAIRCADRMARHRHG